MTTQGCIIAGCVLVDEDHQRAVNGDLFRCGGALIFHGNCWPNGSLMWQEDKGIPNTRPQLVMSGASGFVYEKERTIAFAEDKPWASFNLAALEYLK